MLRKAAFLALGELAAIAVTADSASVARRELDDARCVAQLIGIRHVVVNTREFENPAYLKNDGTRCYHCKTELYTTVERLLPELGVPVMASGANLDDLGDYRPGLTAAAEHSVQGIRFRKRASQKPTCVRLARFWELPTWDKPAAPCLSSRMAPGLAVHARTYEACRRCGGAVAFVGFARMPRAVSRGRLGSNRSPLSEVAKLSTEPVRGELARALHALGFKFVTLDLDGFRSGSLNELVPLELRKVYSGQ